MPAAARPYWTGYLKLSLVTIAVRLYTATTERERVRFHQIHEPSGERVRQQLIVPGIGPVERDEIVKGYEYQKGQYVTVEPDDLKRLKLETTDTIDITQFVDEIDPIYFDAPYYLVPDGSVAEEGYRVIREALRETGKIAIGQVVISGQERIVAIRPLGRGLLGNSLHYQDEIRKPEDFFGTIAEDSVNEKLEGKLPEKAPERKPAQVINLMDALKRSLAEEEKAPEPASRRAAARSEREAAPPAKAAARGRKAEAPSGQRSLLLPVEGGRGRGAQAKEEREAPAEAPKRRRKAS